MESESSSADTECFELTVTDSGSGISAEHLSRIFERFYQVDDSETRKHEGTGIGLALVKELVELHHGQVSVVSEVNTGTAFRVRLPISQGVHSEIVEEELPEVAGNGEVNSFTFDLVEGETTKAPQAHLQSPATSPLILLVDDNADMRTYLSDCLNHEYRLAEANDGEEGLRKASEEMPDLIISDVMMPQIDGLEFCRRIKTNEQTCHIPVILLTARASQDSKLEGLGTGADDYIVKPFDALELRVRVNNLIEQRRTLRKRFGREIKLQPRDITVTSMDEQFLQRAMKIVEKHLSDTDFDVKIFAKEMHISRQHLNRKLQVLTECSPGDFIRTMRLKRAAQLLEKQSATVTEIAYQVGFSNPAYFAECFRELFGRNPSAYASTL
jgi:DNA-binding response OmpR family regulator